MNKLKKNDDGTGIHALQYLSLVRFKALPKIIKNLTSQNIGIILDFEDSSKDIFSPKNTFLLKNECRKGFEFLNRIKIKNKKIFLRINGIKSQHFKKDIVVLKKNINKGFQVNSIFIPKIENYSEIIKIENLLNLKNKNIRLVPIIETKKGFENLNKIFEADKKNKYIYGIHYGHFDFCLNSRVWPMPEPYHKTYWENIFDIAHKCLNNNVYFIQTPFPIINNPKLFYQSAIYLRKNINKLKTYFTLVNYDLRFFKKNVYKIENLRLKKISNDSNFNLKFAKKITSEYESSKKNKKSFSLSKKRFIPPHQYILAKYFLNKNEKK